MGGVGGLGPGRLLGDGRGEHHPNGIEELLAAVVVVGVADSFRARLPAGSVFWSVVVAEREGEIGVTIAPAGAFR